MNLAGLAWANLRAAPLTSIVNVILLGLGTASVVLLLLVSRQFAQTLSRDAAGIDLVLGAKGSPVQLILSSVYHADVPTGNIALDEAQRWARDPRIRRAVPLSLGDSYRGKRIVGTTPDYLDLYGARLHRGQPWKAPMQAVIGAAVQRETGLALGLRFAGAHGLVRGTHDHAGAPYQVVGVLAPTGTVVDRLILTSLESVWQLHGEGKEGHDHDGAHGSHEAEPHDSHDEGEHAASPGHQVTAMLLSYATPLAAISLPQEINAQSTLQAAAPAFELTRLLKIVGVGLDGLRAFAAVLILTAGFSVFAALYGALKARRFDLAMLRCLGATRGEVLLSVLIEGLLLALLGALLGFGLGHVAVAELGQWLASTQGVQMTGWTWVAGEGWLLAGLAGVGLIAAGLPAWQAYRGDVAKVLSEG